MGICVCVSSPHPPPFVYRPNRLTGVNPNNKRGVWGRYTDGLYTKGTRAHTHREL